MHQDFISQRAEMEQQKKFYVAMAIYAAIGLLIWMTIDNIPLPLSAVHLTLRQLTLGILGLFVLRTVLHWRAGQIRAESEQQDRVEG